MFSDKVWCFTNLALVLSTQFYGFQEVLKAQTAAAARQTAAAEKKCVLRVEYGMVLNVV